MILRALGFLLLVIGAIPVTQAQEADQTWRINNIPLDMPLDAELNGEFLEGIYQEKLHDRLIDSVGTPWPSYHIRSTLKGRDGAAEENMELYFSSKADGQRIFWIRTNRRMADDVDKDALARNLAQLERGFGAPSRIFKDETQSGAHIFVYVDRLLPDHIRSRLEESLPRTSSAGDFRDFWAMSLADRARILGTDFRGAIAIINAWQGQLRSVQIELIDLNRARSVFTLAP
jgi:hypothetical protein